RLSDSRPTGMTPSSSLPPPPPVVEPRPAVTERRGDPVPTVSVADVVKEFFANMPSDQSPGKNLDHFLKPDTAVVGISGGDGADRIWTKPARDFLEAAQRETAMPHTVDMLTVSSLGETLAAAVVHFHTDAVRGKAVFTLTCEGGPWRIASLVYETRVPGADAISGGKGGGYPGGDLFRLARPPPDVTAERGGPAAGRVFVVR